MNQTGLSPLLTILLITGLLIGGYFLYGQTSDFPKAPKQTTEVTPSPISDETANWKTYNNSALGFSFSYPKELNYLYDQFGFNHPDNPEGNLLLQNYDGSNPTNEDPANFQLVIDAYKNVNKVTLETFVKDPNKVWNISNSQTFTPFILDGKSAYKGESIQKNKKVPAVWIENNGYILTIYLETPESSKAAWFDQIISTFKFLDQNVEGRFCGGFAANLPENQCPKGYKCQLDGNYPDAGGKCVKI